MPVSYYEGVRTKCYWLLVSPVVVREVLTSAVINLIATNSIVIPFPPKL